MSRIRPFRQQCRKRLSDEPISHTENREENRRFPEAGRKQNERESYCGYDEPQLDDHAFPVFLA